MNLRKTSTLAILACLLGASSWAQSGDMSPAYLVASVDGQQREHSICYNEELDQYLVAYMDLKPGCSAPGISAYRLDGNGNRMGNEITVEPCDTGAGSTSCAYNSVNNEYLVTFVDYSGWSWAQRIDATNGDLKGSNVLVDHTAALEPDLAYSPTSNRYLLAWRDDRYSTIDVRAAVLEGATAQPVGSQLVLTTFTTSIVGNPEIAYNSDLDEFIVVSQVVVEPQTELYAQRVSASAGAIVGGPVRITNSSDSVEWNDGVAYDPDNDRYFLTYECLNTYDIWGQFLGSDGSPTGGRFVINPSGLHGGATQVAWHPGAKEFLVTWQDSASSDNYARRVTSAGVPIGEALRTNGAATGFGNLVPLPVVNTGPGNHDYLICWQNVHTDVYTSRVTLRRYVTSSSPDGAYTTGQMIGLQVTFDRAAYVTGTPQLALNANPDSRGNYLSGSGTNTLTFRYEVNPGDAASDLDYTGTSALSFNGGTIKDASGADIDFALSPPGAVGSLGGSGNIVIDTVRPLVASVTSNKANGTYKSGETINIQVSFTDTMYVTGVPHLSLNTAANRQANYNSGSGSGTISFTYVVQPGDSSPDLDYASIGALVLNGGTIRDAASNDAQLTLFEPGTPGSLGHNKSIAVDAARPTVTGVYSSSPNGHYRSGATVSLVVHLSEPVVVTGVPQLELETGAIDVRADYVSGSGTSVLTFAYNIHPQDASGDLDYKATTSLLPNGGTIKDPAGNFAIMTLAAPSAAGSLAANRDLVIDNVPPGMTVASPSSGVYSTPQSVALAAIEAGTIYYTTDGSEPDTGSSVYTAPLTVASDTTLRFFAMDMAGNMEVAKPQEIYHILAGDGSIASAKKLGIGDPVRLGNKALSFKQGSVGYIEEAGRSAGIRIQGSIAAGAGQLVCLTGFRREATNGEPYIETTALTPCASSLINPVAATNSSCKTAMMEGLLVRVWGKVKPGSLAWDRYEVSDGSGSTGVTVLTKTAPTANEGDLVVITGIASRDGIIEL